MGSSEVVQWVDREKSGVTRLKVAYITGKSNLDTDGNRKLFGRCVR